MRRKIRIQHLFPVLFFLSLFSVVTTFVLSADPVSSSAADPVSFDGNQNIGDLLLRADRAFKLEEEDAVILFNSTEEHWTPDGRAISSVHQIVLIRTGNAISRFADLRIPYNGARQRFTVNTLRTWRLSDKQWIESGPTAQVETLPYAVDHAPDYCHLREMMLLHDGVELPCIVERSYTIEDIEPFRAGMEGHRSLALSVPVVVSRLVLGFPEGSPPAVRASAGLTAAERGLDPSSGLNILTYELEIIPPFPRPRTPESVSRAPHVVWSTWQDWAALGADLTRRFENALQISDELGHRLQEQTADARTEAEKAMLTAKFVAETTRWIHQDTGWWPEPRSAERTWYTAYGTRVDRAVLAAALFHEAGLDTGLIFISDPFGPVNTRVPNLAWSSGPSLLVLGKDVEACFDPASATITNGLDDLIGKTLWRPAHDNEPAVLWEDFGEPGSFSVRFDLKFDGNAQTWNGTGILNAAGALCPFHRMSGLGSEAKTYLSGLTGSLLEGATVNGFNPTVFSRSAVTIGFEVEVPAEERDSMGRLRMAVGSADLLQPLLDHAAVSLIEENRESGIHLPSPIETRIELHLDPGGLDAIYLPREKMVENSAGTARLSVEMVEPVAEPKSETGNPSAESTQRTDSAKPGNDDTTIVLTRQLSLVKKVYEPQEWPELRALLLADSHERGRLVLFEDSGGADPADSSE